MSLLNISSLKSGVISRDDFIAAQEGDSLVLKKVTTSDMTDLVHQSDYVDTFWDDLRFPLVGKRIDVSSGRVDYDYVNGTLNFNSNARYPEEPVVMIGQMPHSWKIGTAIKPHLHWVQTETAIPNFLLAYRVLPNNETLTLESDFTNHTLVPIGSGIFTYTAGNLMQISNFADIDMSGIGISSLLQFVIFRDSVNVSGLFAGSDTVAGDAHSFEFDIHFEIDRPGSRDEYVK